MYTCTHTHTQTIILIVTSPIYATLRPPEGIYIYTHWRIESIHILAVHNTRYDMNNLPRGIWEAPTVVVVARHGTAVATAPNTQNISCENPTM